MQAYYFEAKINKSLNYTMKVMPELNMMLTLLKHFLHARYTIISPFGWPMTTKQQVTNGAIIHISNVKKPKVR